VHEHTVYVVEPAGKGTAKSLAAGRPLWPVEHPITLDTIADGMRVGNVADKCFNVLHAHAQHHVFAVVSTVVWSCTPNVCHMYRMMNKFVEQRT
jgi:threonine dehydratase